MVDSRGKGFTGGIHMWREMTEANFAFDVFDPVFSFKVLESYMDLAGLDYTWNYRGMLVMHC